MIVSMFACIKLYSIFYSTIFFYLKTDYRKKLRADIQTSFHGLTAEDLAGIIPNKGDVTTVKIYTHTGDNAFIYCVNKQPILFQTDKQKVIYPTGTCA